MADWGTAIKVMGHLAALFIDLKCKMACGL